MRGINLKEEIMRVQLKTNYLAKDLASVQTNNTCDNSNTNFASTFRISQRKNGSWVLMKILRSVLESLKPTAIINTNTEGEFANHLLVSFPGKKDDEVLRVLQNTLANENGIRCHRLLEDDLTEEKLRIAKFDHLPVYSFVKPSNQNNGNPFKPSPIIPVKQYAAAV